MNDFFKKCISVIFCLAAFTASGFVHAGAYEDFFSAVEQDNPGAVSALLARGFDANTTNLKGQTGLYVALTEPSPKTAQVLVDWPKTDVNKLNAKSESALMLAALKGSTSMVEKLIKKGADINKTGWTPLHYAATTGQAAIISLLLENSAYIDAESPNGSTPLMMAAMYGSTEAVKVLLQEGADTSLKNQQGLTALDFAQRSSRPDAIELIASTARSKQPRGKW
ncbi:MAG: Ankyrin [Polaromonas sp.]|nr:Ankyrin [Polaromonas sp.]